MRYAIISDVHANRQAMTAVLTDIFSNGVDAIISLGDLVGYGPEPAAVLQDVHSRVTHFVMGNHDAVIGGELDPAAFNRRARRLIDWTAEQLDASAGAFLARQPYVFAGPTFRCTHGSPVSPGTFTYVLEKEHALSAWGSSPEQFMFIGHSHVPGLYVLGNSGTPHWLEPMDFGAEDNKRYIINVGSVGQPRDGDVRASYCLFDLERGDVRFRRVPFDLAAYREALARAESPEQRTFFLEVADRATPVPLRDMLDFHPLQQSQVHASDVSIKPLRRAKSSVRRWRLATAAMGLLLLALTTLAWKGRSRPASGYAEYEASVVSPRPIPDLDSGCLPLPDVIGEVGLEARLEHWSVGVSDPAEQAVYAESMEGVAEPVFRLVSNQASPIRLRSTAVNATAGMRFDLQVRCRAGRVYDGHAEMKLVQQTTDGSSRLVVHYPLRNIPSERWKYCHKMSPPEGLPEAGPVHLELEGTFTGELILRTCDLRRSE